MFTSLAYCISSWDVQLLSLISCNMYVNSSEQPWPFAKKLLGTYLNVLEYYMLESLPVRRDKLKWLSQE